MKWTEKEIKLLQVLREVGKTNKDIAMILGRSYEAVKSKAKGINIETGNFIRELGTEIVKRFRPIKLDVISKPKTNKKGKEEASIIDISDIHVGMINEVFDVRKNKKIVTYNFDIFKKQFDALCYAITELNTLLSNIYSLRTIYVNILGDIVTNDRIFPEQPFEIEKVAGLQIWDAVNYLIMFINFLCRFYPKVIVTCVVGNHGRSRELHNEPVENNFEYFIYKVIERQFESHPNVTVFVPTTRYAIVDIMGHRHLLTHGDIFRGYTDNYILQQIKELYINIGNFSVLDYGHFHKIQERELSDKVLVKQNGSWIPKDNYALKTFKTYSVPKQWFYGCNEKRYVTWSYQIDFRT